MGKFLRDEWSGRFQRRGSQSCIEREVSGSLQRNVLGKAEDKELHEAVGSWNLEGECDWIMGETRADVW